MSDNPYAAIDPSNASDPTAFLPGPEHIATIRQVKTIAILQIVLGLVEMLVSAILIGFGFLMAYGVGLQESMPPGQKETFFMLKFFYWGAGAVILHTSFLRLLSGVYGVWYRGYWLTVISLFAGLVTTFTCYCAPLSIGLCIYGLTVYFNPAVVYAFSLARQGMSQQEIFDRFTQIRPPSLTEPN